MDKVQTLLVQYSKDAVTWAGSETITMPNALTLTHTVTTPTEARYIRILVSIPHHYHTLTHTVTTPTEARYIRILVSTPHPHPHRHHTHRGQIYQNLSKYITPSPSPTPSPHPRRPDTSES